MFPGTIIVTCAYLLFWYYLLLARQGRTKRRLEGEYAARGEVFDRYFGQDAEMLAVDRVVANTHEQMVPFLVSMWLFSALVSSFYATVLGATYLVLRVVYPMLLGKRLSKINPMRVAYVTFPCYAIVLVFIVGSMLAALKL